MKNTQKLFLGIIAFLLSGSTMLYAQTTDSLELVNLYNATDGPNWTNNDNWLVPGQPISTWYGLTVDPGAGGFGGVVGEIDLSGNNLSGTLPALSFSVLNIYDVSHNNLSGVVPNMGLSPAGGTTTLDVFNITYNQFTYADISPNVQFNQPIGNNEGFRYAQQYGFFGSAQALLTKVGDTVTLNANYEGPPSNDLQFEWRRDRGEVIAKQFSADSTYQITSLTPGQLGRYYSAVSDVPGEPGMEFISYDVLLYNYTVGPNGSDIRPNELILDFSLLNATQLSSVSDLITAGDIAVIDSCNCTKDIVLLDIINEDTDVLKGIVPTTGKQESAEDESRSGDVQDNNYDIRLGEQKPADIWDLSFLNQPLFIKNTPLIKIAVIDTGHESNPLLNDYEINDNPPHDACIFGANFVDNNSNIAAKHPHGNHISSLILKDVNPETPIGILPVKAFGEDGSGTLFDMICGIHYALDNNARVINISAGYTGEKSDLLEAALDRSRKEKAIIVTAAGNGDENGGFSLDDKSFYPAVLDHNNMVVVGSITPNDKLSKFSNYSESHVDILAYGECIKGAGLGGDTEILSGTSQSTALVTREIAIQIAHVPSSSFKEIIQRIPKKDITITDYNGDSQTVKKIDITQELTGWLKYLLIGLFVLFLIIFIIWRIWKNNNP